MTQEAAKKAWTKPKLKRLGEINDVAGGQGAGPQPLGKS